MVGVRSAVHTAVFDPGVGLANAGVRRGLKQGIEVNADVTYARVIWDGLPAIDRNIYAGRVGAKLGYRGMVALTAGMGGGYAPAAGGFTAGDLGIVVSYDNCYVVPFLSASTYLSIPIGARPVNLGDGWVSTASTTYGWGMATGLEIPLARQRCREGLTPPRIQLGLNMTSLTPTAGPNTKQTPDGSETTGGTYGAFGLGVGIEFPL